MKKPRLTADKLVLDDTTDIFDLRRLRFDCGRNRSPRDLPRMQASH